MCWSDAETANLGGCGVDREHVSEVDIRFDVKGARIGRDEAKGADDVASRICGDEVLCPGVQRVHDGGTGNVWPGGTVDLEAEVECPANVTGVLQGGKGEGCA